MVFDSENRFCMFLMTIPQLSRLILIPHLQPWLLYKTGQEEEEDSFISGGGDGGEGEDDALDVVSIAGVANKPATRRCDYGGLDEKEFHEYMLVQQKFDPTCNHELPVLCDIRESEPDTWWLFPPEDCYTTTVDNEHWFLVNYKLRKLYMGPNGTEAYYWDNVWDIPARQPRAKARTSSSRRSLVDKAGADRESLHIRRIAIVCHGFISPK
jgi:hypothetical protein